MKNYESYTLVDFIQDDEFRDWVRGHTHQEGFWAAFPKKPNLFLAFIFKVYNFSTANQSINRFERNRLEDAA